MNTACIKKLYVDLDETLLDSISVWLQWIYEVKNVIIKREDILTYEHIFESYGSSFMDFWNDPSYYNCDTIKPLNGAIEFIDALKSKYGKDNITIATWSYNDIVPYKNEIAKKFFGINNVIHSKEKWKHTCDGVLVDDAPHNIEEHSVNNHGILFNYDDMNPWARKSNTSYKANSYNKVLDILEGINGNNRR